MLRNIFQVNDIKPPRFDDLMGINGDKYSHELPSENINVSRFGLGSIHGMNNDISESFISRPATAILKVFDRFSSMSGLRANSPASKNPYTFIINKDKSLGNITAYNLQTRMDKIIRLNNKLAVQQLELFNELMIWASDIPDADCETFVKEFSTLVSTQHECNITLNEKIEKLKFSFKLVNKRERKLKDLNASRLKIIKGLRDNEVKYGPNASSTTFLGEKLEETMWNLDVLEQQYIRSISKDLKDSLIDYSSTLQSVAANITDSTKTYYSYLYNLEAVAELNKNSPKKFFNPIGPGMKRSDNQVSSPKYSPKKFFNGPSLYKPNQNDENIQRSPIKMYNVENVNENYCQNPCPDCYGLKKMGRNVTSCTHLDENASIVNKRPMSHIYAEEDADSTYHW